MRVAVAWVLVALCAAWAAVRLLGLERGYPLVPLIAYTPFVAAAAVVVVVVALLLRQRGAAIAATVLAALLLVTVAPRALGGSTAPEGAAGPDLRVLSANMHGTGSAEALVALARRERADVLSVQELTPGLARRLEAAGLGELMPEQILEPGGPGSGIGLYSRLPLATAEAPGERRNALVIAGVIVEGAPPVEVAAVHPPPPLRGSIMPDWRGDLRALPPATPEGPLRILAGDFNATVDHAELRRLLDTGYEDAAAQVGAGLKATWPANRRFPPPVAIDHVLADARCGVRGFSVHAIPSTDHRAVLAELVLPRG
jgi:endonuclease/exonuclease/phosphatase (EEP) superfamily protein YafD